MSEELMSPKEVARVLGCSPRTVFRLLEQGRLPRLRFSPKMVRIPRGDVDRLIASAHVDEPDEPSAGET